MTDAEGQLVFRFAHDVVRENADLREELLKAADVMEAYSRRVRRFVFSLPPLYSSPRPDPSE